MAEQALRLLSQAELTAILEQIGAVYPVQEYGGETVSLTCFDTFDWRLAGAGLSLSRKGSRYRLMDRRTNSVLADGPASRKQKVFAGELPEGELRDRLQPIIKQRVLLSRFILEGDVRYFNLLNNDQKTVMRLTVMVQTGRLEGQRFSLDRIVLADVLRGYERCWKKIRPLLVAAGAEELEKAYDPVGMVQDALHIVPAEVESKFDLALSGDETVEEAVRDICLYLRRKLIANIQGSLDDLDVEFLHDLRVNVRRTRSLLSLMKKYLPEEELARYRQELKWVGTVTGPVRDLDVYLMKEDDFNRMLPPELREGLSFFFDELTARRRRELKKLRQHLRSERFTTLLDDWQSFLHQLPRRKKTTSHVPLRDVVEAIIRKRLARIVKKGCDITRESSDEKVHELRIEGKKFRYLLEFFRSLYDDKLVDEYLRQMKRLQNLLGDFNDCSVQKNMLIGHLSQLDRRDTHSCRTAAALGGLVVHLHEEQRRLRTGFEETIAAFATGKNLGLMEQILAPAHDESDKEPDV